MALHALLVGLLLYAALLAPRRYRTVTIIAVSIACTAVILAL